MGLNTSSVTQHCISLELMDDCELGVQRLIMDDCELGVQRPSPFLYFILLPGTEVASINLEHSLRPLGFCC